VGPGNLTRLVAYHASECTRQDIQPAQAALVKGDLAIDWNDEVFSRRRAHARRTDHAEATRKAVEGQNDRRVIALYSKLAAFTGLRSNLPRCRSSAHADLHVRIELRATACYVGDDGALARRGYEQLRVIGVIGVDSRRGQRRRRLLVTEAC